MRLSQAGRRVHYAWVVAALTFVTLLASAGMRSTPGVIILPLEQEFGWNRAVISFAVSINLFLYGLCGPFAAAFMERFGVRRVMAGALLVTAAGAGLTAVMRTPWQLDLLWGVVVGTATGAIATVLGATVATQWFVQRRGLVLGLLSASSATGQLIFVPLLMTLVVALGWRAASIAAAGTALLLLPLVLMLMRNRPEDVGLRPYGAAPQTPPISRLGGNPTGAALRGLARGMRSGDFWLLAGSLFICGATAPGLVGTHLIPNSIEHGIPEVAAASFLAVIGGMDIIGTTCSGWLSDRFDSRWLLAWYYGGRGLALLFLPYAYGTGFFGLAVFVVVYGLDWVATFPPSVRLTADIFGKENVGILVGWLMVFHQLGAAIAATGAGAIRAWMGDYQGAFILGGLLCLIAAGLAVRIGHAKLPTGRGLPAPRVAIADSRVTVGG